MPNRIDLVVKRLTVEEGTRLLCYDDATGKTVKAPVGHITWGNGFNLDVIGSPGLFDCMMRYLTAQIDAQLVPFGWYRAADETRKSVFLDIAYNGGVGGLRNFPNMLAAAAAGDWERAALECRVVNPELAGRYKALAELLRKGDTVPA
jgi:GH24 family phage-related lysozyme (muramidase)